MAAVAQAARVAPPIDVAGVSPVRSAIEGGAAALIALQDDAGGWEGEVAWCPMLAAQYVILCHLTNTDLPPERRRRLLRQFDHTRLESGLWGLHELAPPYLFVTALVYVAMRLLDVQPDDPRLVDARAFMQREGVISIPSWGKLWLALVGLFDWRGVPPLVPELWALPRALPVHPSKYYCHTRLIYLAMCSLYARRPQPPVTPVIAALRTELYPQDFAQVDWPGVRYVLRREEIFTPPSVPLRILYRLLALLDHHPPRARRRRLLAELDERMRFELRTTDHTCLSPVSGFLTILALRAADPDDPEAARGLDRVEGWIWEDDEQGLRVAGARSASWDTAFALQALAAAGPHANVTAALERGDAFLRTQQIAESFPGYAENFRVDPRGGFCFAGVWHGWPVSDCTAEAVCALLDAKPNDADHQILSAAVDFLLRGQNPDGGFGSYEARRLRIGLEWLNPAEMFGDSMTEHSYVECTASCVEALASVRRHIPQLVSADVERVIVRGGERLRQLQQSDGTWRGVWGVHFVYGTMFGLRGLVAAGAPPGDPAVRRGCRWLLAHQRADGGWGEDWTGCLRGTYVEHRESQVIHTSWALLGLLVVRDPNWDAIVRGANFLAEAQDDSGHWPRQDPVGIFFHTALLDYVLYRQYFPLWALSLYESRRRERRASSGPAVVGS